MRAVLVDWMVITSIKVIRGRQSFIKTCSRLVSTFSSTCCKRPSSLLWQSLTGDLIKHFFKRLRFLISKQFEGTCKKRLPVSAARSFSWWASPACSQRPSIERLLEHQNTQFHLSRYEEIYAPEIKDFVYITGLSSTTHMSHLCNLNFQTFIFKIFI